MPEANQDNQKEFNEDFPYEAYKLDGKLILKNVNTEKVIELDFDVPQNSLTEDAEKWLQEASKKMEEKGTKGSFTEYCGGEVTQACIDKAKKSGDPKLVKKAQFAENVRGIAKKKKKSEDMNNLPKNGKKNNMNNNKKNDETMGKDEEIKETETKTEDTKDIKGIVDGQPVDTPAEGDDYEAGDKVKGDPYNETEKYSKKDMEKLISKTAMDLVSKAIEGKLNEFHEKLSKDLAPILEKNKKEAEIEKNDLINTLQKDPYRLSEDSIKELTLEQLREKRDLYNELPLIQDFFKDNEHLTHEQVNKYAFDMQPPEDHVDARSAIFQKAQKRFITHDLGEEKYKQDFGGMYQ